MEENDEMARSLIEQFEIDSEVEKRGLGNQEKNGKGKNLMVVKTKTGITFILKLQECMGIQ